MFSLSGTFISDGQNFLSNMCTKRTSRAHIAKSLWPGSRARLRALEAKGILMLSGAFCAYIGTFFCVKFRTKISEIYSIKGQKRA